MPRVDLQLTNFTSGELSPRLLGRTDLTRYFNGAGLIRNFIVHPHGGLTRRPGTYFCAEVKDSNKFTRVIPFEFSTVEAYILELGNLYVRFYANQGQIQSAGVPYEVVGPWTEAQLVDLKFTQSADIIYVCHPDVRPKQINRFSDTNWTITNYAFQDGPYLAMNTDAAKTLASSVTAIGASGTLTAAGHTPFAATDVGRLVRLRVGSNWGWGEITSFVSTTVVNWIVRGTIGGTGADPDWRLGAWSDTTGWPACAGFYEERLCFGYTDNRPSNVWGSTSGDFTNHAPSAADGTVRDDDALDFQIADDKVNAIRWISGGRDLLVGTQGAEYLITGGPNSPLTPTNLQVKRQTTYGSYDAALPARLGSSVMFIQRAGRKVRELAFNFEVDGYRAPDLTILSEHISSSGFVDMDYQQEPDSILWHVRADGFLVGMTFEKEQEVVAWHGHDIGGTFGSGPAVVESIAVIPDPTDSYNELWMVVARTINGATKRYIEFMTGEFNSQNGLVSAHFVDSGLNGDGRVATTLLLSDSTVGVGRTFTAGVASFVIGDIGRQIWANNGRAVITGFTSSTVVTCEIILAFDDVSYTADEWGLASKTFGGLGHLEGQTVAVLRDGAVHPNVVVTGGQVTLNAFTLRAVIGLPYTSRLETLPVEPRQGETIQAKTKRIVKSTIRFHESLGAKYGSLNEADKLEVIPFRSGGDPMDSPPPLFTGDKEISVPMGWDNRGEMLLIQDQPLPMTVLMIVHDTWWTG